MKELYKETEKVFMRILMICIIGAFIFELIFGFVLLAQGEYTRKTFSSYIFPQCIVPTIMAIIMYVILYVILDSPNIKNDAKNIAQIIILNGVILSITGSHTRFTVLIGLFMITIIFTGIYGRTGYIRLATETSILGAIITICIRFMFYDEITFEQMMVSLIGIAMISISVPFAYIVRTFVNANKELLEQQIRNQVNLGKQISIDAMTGLYNHTAFYDELDRLIKETDQTKEKLCIAVVDIDNFKSVNDTYGHSRGDEVLIYLSKLLQKICKDHIVCRYGGEEFGVIFKNLGLKDSARMMNDVLDEFGSHTFEWCDSHITFSCGVCKHYDIRVNSEELFKQADKYLYKAKRDGKNRVVSE